MKSKSIENWAAGELLLKDGKANAATSRFYYALFQSAREYAEMYLGYIDPDENNHVALYEFLTGNLLPKKKALILRMMLLFRQKRKIADYKKKYINKDDLIPFLDSAEEVLNYFQEEL